MKDLSVSVHDLRSFTVAIFKKIGSDEAESAIVSEHLIEANLTGHDSHGVLRVPQYIEWCKNGFVRTNQNLNSIHKNGPFAVVDGNFGFGQVIGEQATTLGIETAKHCDGISIVGLRNSGHLGRIGDFALQAAEAGFVSLHFVNTNGFGIRVAPFGGTDARLSTNPIAIGIPRKDGEHVVLDMATSTYAEGKIRSAVNRGEELPDGILIDSDGNPTRDPRALYTNPPGALLPLGGYKGYGLSVICEILAGSLTGSGSSNPKNPTVKGMVNGMLSIYFTPGCLGQENEFEMDISSLIAWVTGSPIATPGTEVLFPGEIERKRKEARLLSGIPLDVTTRNQLIASAELLCLDERSFAFLS